LLYILSVLYGNETTIKLFLVTYFWFAGIANLPKLQETGRSFAQQATPMPTLFKPAATKK
jgi:hypothetical protein